MMNFEKYYNEMMKMSKEMNNSINELGSVIETTRKKVLIKLKSISKPIVLISTIYLLDFRVKIK